MKPGEILDKYCGKPETENNLTTLKRSFLLNGGDIKYNCVIENWIRLANIFTWEFPRQSSPNIW